MQAFKITSKGQVTIPKEIRDSLRLSNGDRIMFIHKDGEIIIRKAIAIDKLLDVTGSRSHISDEEILNTIKEVRKEIQDNGGHYPRQF